jgi:predicted HTH domain antitoxin
MKTLQMEIPEAIFLSLKETPEQLTQEIRIAAAAKLYELGKISSGLAAQLAGMPRVSFLQILGKYGVSVFNLTSEELQQDMENA